VLSVYRCCARAVPCHRGAIVRRPSPSRSRRAVPRRQGSAAPSLAVEEPPRRPLPSRSRRTVPHHQGAVGRVD
jgi:hypothetical protein